MSASEPELTRLLHRFQEGDAAAAEELLPLVYAELHRLARKAMQGAPGGHTLQATALLNEAWMRIARHDGTGFSSREHFLAVAAKAIRSVFVDHARKRNAAKRGSEGRRVDLDRAVHLAEERAGDLIELDLALEQLAAADPTLARIVEMRFFGGLSHPEIAALLELPLRRVERGWQTARTWLHTRLAGDGASPEA